MQKMKIIFAIVFANCFSPNFLLYLCQRIKKYPNENQQLIVGHIRLTQCVFKISISLIGLYVRPY